MNNHKAFLYSLFIVSQFAVFVSTFQADPFIKGMTISCQTWGYEWATPEMKETLHELKSLGVNSFSIHPYARIREDGSVSYKKNRDSNHISTPLKWAKELGMSVMLKPHLAYWGTKFRWRGDINFKDKTEWDRFFKSYREWIIEMAIVAEEFGADIFCIGLEYRHSLAYDQNWREIISAVKEVYSGKITYAANWDIYKQVKFWDALDYIGIQAYFPLIDIEDPTDEQLRESWTNIFNQIDKFAHEMEKKVIFTEIGYNTSTEAAKIPWSPNKSHEQAAFMMQEKCLRIALEETRNEIIISGVYLWKWFAETQPFEQHENFNLQRPAVKSLIRQVWK